ncbi:dUTP diphosphatase [Alkaliphilus hydrothermalis]|uniref:Dimeric dUTPase (All-alpha-NTP-PPase superfamily) n=1 Tax=Alkaliphilus hydrothermalis TaxID=1482730 RepID=A0ABS2NQN7_9FIRM|nr:dUTP diphosphatase [Alkaliphilus hydrothermalis]MBM7615262.1 dimeric dUTPase (all-alpha-NTP-PPase superfamily) [Alkaliphilus hydrothermalis]
MELKELFKIQDLIENSIKNFTDLQEDYLGSENVFDLKFLALQVKTAEIANLTKCYKYSKIKPNIPKEKLFTRVLDSMGFLLSIGNTHSFNIIDLNAINRVEKDNSIIKTFSSIFDDITALRQALLQEDFYRSLSIYIRLFAQYLHLCDHLDIGFQEIYDYYQKRYNSPEASN